MFVSKSALYYLKNVLYIILCYINWYVKNKVLKSNNTIINTIITNLK